jgi:pimeloyl-ACP methyl ester carboxylesterase
MGSLITNILFMPPKKIHDEAKDNDGDTLLKTRHGSEIQVKTYIKDPKYLYMIISHGNAEDIYMVYEWVSKILVNFVNVNIIMYEYTGYGLNQESFPCSEQFCYNDADAVYTYVTTELNVPPERIIIFGRSLGSGPSCYLAEKYPVGGLILNSGFMSVFRVVFKFRWTLPGDMFPNIDRIKNVKCPVCIVHSIKDEIVPFYHARQMYKNCKNKFDPLFIDGTSHNSIDKVSDDVYKHMQKFFKHIDPNYEPKDPRSFYEDIHE